MELEIVLCFEEEWLEEPRSDRASKDGLSYAVDTDAVLPGAKVSPVEV